MKRTFVETTSFRKRVDEDGPDLLRHIQEESLKRRPGKMAKSKLARSLISGLKEAITHGRKTKKLRVTELEIPPPAREWKRKDIIRLRKDQFGVSQPIFASFLSVTVSTVRAWEQGQKSPGGTARRLLEVAEIEPAVFQKIAHV